ncbi:MAG: single-stranded DNA-binding protein [Armatimonadetes bacterium]|nr:single-stranded DNA-binding protein [Armatimonadota bacterium]
MLNRIVLIGRLTADPEERHTNSGTVLVKFRLAVDRIRKGPDGEKMTDFFGVTCFRQTAEFVQRYLSKGDLAAVDGRCEIDEYTDRDGNRRTAVQVTADNVQKLTPRGEGGGGGGRSEGGGREFEHADDFGDSDRSESRERPARQEREAPRESAPRKQEFNPPAGGSFDDDDNDPFADA